MNKPLKNTRVKAILIDSSKQQIHLIEFQGIASMYQILDCDAIQGRKSYWAGLHNDEVMYFDDDAVIKQTNETRFAVGHSMLPPEQVTPIVGRVLICRVLPNGTMADTSLGLVTMERLIRFYTVTPKQPQNTNTIKLN
jgi:hypothetical protein